MAFNDVPEHGHIHIVLQQLPMVRRAKSLGFRKSPHRQPFQERFFQPGTVCAGGETRMRRNGLGLVAQGLTEAERKEGNFPKLR